MLRAILVFLCILLGAVEVAAKDKSGKPLHYSYVVAELVRLEYIGSNARFRSHICSQVDKKDLCQRDADELGAQWARIKSEAQKYDAMIKKGQQPTRVQILDLGMHVEAYERVRSRWIRLATPPAKNTP